MTNTVKAFTPSQQKALRLLKAGKNVFLTGKAGTGKSFLTREFIKMNSDKNILICAPTGIAALNIGGSTIHRAFGAPIGIVEPKKLCQSKEKMEAIDKAEIILIDEISMCRTDLFGFVASSASPRGDISGVMPGRQELRVLSSPYSDSAKIRMIFYICKCR